MTTSWKWMPAVLGLFAGMLLHAQELELVVAEPQSFGTQDRLFFPSDPRQFRGWRHTGGNAPLWAVHPELPNDVFTFARLRYPVSRGGRWTADYPEAELNLSYRLHDLTAIQVNPYPVIVSIDAEQMRHYPFIYVSEPQRMSITARQAQVFRDYMLNGGFIMIDDFWGEREWAGFMPSFKKIWPDRGYVELDGEHPLFHCVFDLPEPPLVHSDRYCREMREFGRCGLGNETKPDAATPHFRAVHDDRGRMVMLICLNNDMGDGWERESSDPWYFTHVSEKLAFPMGINIVSYVLTH